jgi:glycosyltransferase involved in cell wall biosynthesis
MTRILALPISTITSRFINRKLIFLNKLSKIYDVYVLDVKEPWSSQIRGEVQGFLVDKELFSKINFFHNYKINIPNLFLNEVVNFPSNFYNVAKICGDKDIRLIIDFDQLLYGWPISKILQKFCGTHPMTPYLFDISDYLPSFVKDLAVPFKFRRVLEGTVKVLGDSTIKTSSCITTASNCLADYIKMIRGDQSVSVISNGVDTSFFTPQKKIFDDEKVRVGYVGAFRWWTGLDEVIKACSTVVKKIDCEFFFVGGGPEYSYYSRLAESLGVKKYIHFTGMIEHSRIPEILNNLDICLLPFKKNILTDTSSPIKLFEYIATGRPVISTELDEPKRIFSNYIHYANTSEEIAQKIIELASNPSLSKSLATKAREIVLSNFDWNQIANKFFELSKNIIES